MLILENIRSCVRRKHRLSRRPTKVYFNVSIYDAFKSENIASQLRDLLVYIAREGVTVTDLFRRPGNPQQMKKIIADLEAGRQIDWTQYNFYTLANIAKRFLLHINGGLLGNATEEALLRTLDLPDDQSRIEAMHNLIVAQPKPVQQLLALFFGTWFRMIYHTEVNAMSVEAVAKSVAGSVFPSCTYSIVKVERASKVVEYLIIGFASVDLFGRELIEYFTRETKTCISRVEKFKYEFIFPKYVPRERSIRMFMQMLLDESKKHGFDIKSDAVSRDAFELANVNNASFYVLSPHMTDDQLRWPLLEPDLRSISGKTNNVPTQYATNLRTPLSQIQTNTDTSFEPISRGFPTNDNFSTHLDRVKQVSEKRTRVMPPSYSPDREEGSTVVSANHCELHSQKLLILRNTLPNTCFGSIRRRQMERLQMRSNWFLSPPSGVKSASLMRLNPSVSSGGALWSKRVLYRLNENCRKFDGSWCDVSLPQLIANHNGFNGREESFCDCHCTASPEAISAYQSQHSYSNSLPKCSSLESHYKSSQHTVIDQLFDEYEEIATRYFIVKRCYGPDS